MCGSTKRFCLSMILLLLTAAASGQPVSLATNPDLAVNKWHLPNQQVASWQVGVPITYVITVDNAGAANNHVSVTDNFPAGFVLTGITCSGASGAVCPGGTLTPPKFGEFKMPTGSKIILNASGYYKLSGIKNNEAKASAVDDQGQPVPAGNVFGKDQISIDDMSVPVDLKIVKSVTPVDTVFDPSKAKLHYTLKVTNESTTATVNVGGLLVVRDRLRNSSTIKVEWKVPSFGCVSSPGTHCPDMPAPTQGSLPANNSTNFFFAYDTGANQQNDAGTLLPGGSFTIDFDVELETAESCSTGKVTIQNVAFLDLGNSFTLLSDVDTNNNTSITSTEIAGLPITCPPAEPGVLVTKIQDPLSPSVWAPGSVKYIVTVKNPRTTAMTNLVLADSIRKESGTPPFTATVTQGPTCVSGCNPLTSVKLTNIKVFSPTITADPPPNNTADQTFDPLWTADLALLPPGQTVTIEYSVRYTPVCETDEFTNQIRNRFRTTIPKGGGGSESSSVDIITSPPEVSRCGLLVTKTRKSDEKVKFGDAIEFDVIYKNTSGITQTVGTLRDVASISDQQYGNVPMTYEVACTVGPQPTDVIDAPANKPATNGLLTYAQHGWLGTKLIDAPKPVTFKPNGELKCTVKITLTKPTSITHCQGAGDPRLINFAFMDLSAPYNPNVKSKPLVWSQADARLPLCRTAIVTKNAVLLPGQVSASYGPGTLMKYLITVTNVGKDDLFGMTLQDPVPPPLLPVSVSACTPLPSSCTSPPALTGNVVNVQYGPLKPNQGVSFELTVKTPQAGGSYPNTVKGSFLPGGEFYFRGDDKELLEQEEHITVLTPKLAKSFTPATLGPTGTATLTFDITNVNSDPAQSGMAFTDTVPAGLTISAPITNTCGGTVTISSDGRSLTLAGGALAAGTHACRITARITALGICGVYRNTKTNFTAVVNVDVSTVDEALTVEGCPPSLVIRKEVEGAPAGFSATFPFTVTCSTPTGPYTKSLTIVWPSPGMATVTDIPAGSQCTVKEGTQPAAPQGFGWITPEYTPAGGVVTLGDKGAQVTVRNKLEPRESCLRIIGSEVSCEVDDNGNPTGKYVWKFRFQNLTGRPISHVYVSHLAAPVAALPNDYISFAPAVTNISPLVQFTFANAQPGPLSFTLTLQDQGVDCCSMRIDLELPECDCAQIVREVTPSCFSLSAPPAPPFLYTFQLQNLTSLPVDHVFVTPVSTLDHVTPVPSSAVKVDHAVHPIAPLGPGDTMATPVTVAISGTQATGGAKVCLSLTLRSQDPHDCCCAIVRCFTLPDCSFDPGDYDVFGDVDFRLVDGGFFIEGFDTTGEDGVRIDLDGARAAELAWRPLDAKGPLPDGAFLELRAAATDGGPTGSIRVTQSAGEYRIVIGKGGDAQAYTAEVFQGGELVGSASSLRSAVNVVVIWPVAGGVEVVPAPGDIPGEAIAFTLRSPGPVPWRLGDGTSLAGDLFRLTPEETSASSIALDTLELRAAGIPSIEVTGTSIFHDCNGNGQPDADDIATGFSEDLNGDGKPDECALATDLTVNLATGFDDAAGTVLPVGTLPAGTSDDDWRVIVPGPEGPAKVVIDPPASWAAALPGTRWISVDPDQGKSVPNATTLAFRRCFCLAATASDVRLDMQLRADNAATVLLNGRTVAGPGGAFNAAPLRVLLTGRAGDGTFIAGQNCLTIEVADQGVAGGLNAAGTVTATNASCD